ncbi:MAG: spore coat protein U domain-containing protein [Kofleriaceae bacterium]
MKTVIILLAVMATPRIADAGCSYSTISPVSFSYNPLSTGVTDGSGYVTYKCTAGTTSITVDIDYGGRGNRTMVGSISGNTDTLAYTLFQDATRLIAWGNTALTHMTIIAPPTVFTQLPVYGRMAAKQDVTVDSYSDTMTVTITY